MDKTAAVVILYNPEISFIDNITSYIYNVGHVFIFDNSPKTHIEFISNFPFSRYSYFHDGINNGIAKRLNEACCLAHEIGFQWLLTMDQDSSFRQTSLEQYFENIQRFTSKKNVALFGIENDSRRLKENVESFKNVDTLITSGSILNLSLYNKIGGFNEALFIDLVDFEYCLKASLKGFDVIKFDGLLLQHQIGEKAGNSGLGNFLNNERAFHPPLRLYYMFRNYLYLRKKYADYFPKVFSSFRKDLFNRIKNNLLYTKNKTSTVKFIWKAWKDFRHNNMGKIS